MLRISEAASLALHTAVYLAVRVERLVTTHEVAELLGVSETHLAKVMQRLVRVGLVRSTRGPHGGFALARAGEQISLLEVYEAIEGPLTQTECLLEEPVCQGSTCILGDLISEVASQARDYLAGTMLSELTGVYREVAECEKPGK